MMRTLTLVQLAAAAAVTHGWKGVRPMHESLQTNLSLLHSAADFPPYTADPGLCGSECKQRLGQRTSPKLVNRYLRLAEMSLTGSLSDRAGSCETGYKGCSLARLRPYPAPERWIGRDWPPFGETMAGHLRLRNVRAAIESVISQGVAGDFAELGVWRGGLCIFAKLVMDAYGDESRRVHVFDAFGRIAAYGTTERQEYLGTNQKRVMQSFMSYDAWDTDRVLLHSGLFKETTRRFRMATTPRQTQLAVLRIDANFYESYEDAFYNLYDLVPVGGIVIIDDYSDKSVRAFVSDFMSDYGAAQIHEVDWTGVWWRKGRAATIDFSRKRYKEADSPVFPI